MAKTTVQHKLRALLPHWIEHNQDHAAEFRRWAVQAGEAAADIEAAAAQMEVANQALVVALEKLGGAVHPAHHHEHAHEE
jgi:hypothetical protein